MTIPTFLIEPIKMVIKYGRAAKITHNKDVDSS